MRASWHNIPIAFSLLLTISAPAVADPQSYCEVYARDYAQSHHSPSAKHDLYELARKNCLARYQTRPDTEEIGEAATGQEKPSQRALSKDGKDKLEWHQRCAARYASFDPQTGTYRSLTGKLRRCPLKP